MVQQVNEYITIENAMGMDVTIGNGSTYGLSSLEGTGDLETDLQMQQAPYMDGRTYITSYLEPRYIDVELIIHGDNYKDVQDKRRALSSVLNPKLGLSKLTYTTDNGEWWIDAIAESLPKYADGDDSRGIRWQRAIVTLVCPNPYWKSPNRSTKPLKAYVGNFTLPFTLPFELGVSGSSTVVYNEGNVPAPVEIYVEGPITNPQIINRTTGERIKVNRTIAEDETLYINTAQGEKAAEIRRGNEVKQVFGYLDHDSDWLMLEIGENRIEHIADSGNRKATVFISWESRYTGV